MLTSAAAFALYLAVVLALLQASNWDPSSFVLAAENFTDRNAVPAEVTVFPGAGYDGQFFFRLAMHPLSTAHQKDGIHFDYPVYRHQRIVYPLLARLIGFGRARPTLWALILVNLAAVAALTYTVGLVLSATGTHPGWGIAVPLYAGFLLTIARDLCEIVAVGFLIATIHSLQKERVVRAVALLSIATFAKEPALLFAAGPIAVACFGRLRTRNDRMRLLFVIPPLLHIAWKRWLFYAWDIPPSFSLEPLARPFSAYFTALGKAAAGSVVQVELLLLAALVMIAAPAIWTSSLRVEKTRLGCGALAILAFSLGSGFWMKDWAFLRAVSEFASLAILLALTGARWQRVSAAFLSVTSWCLIAMRLLA